MGLFGAFLTGIYTFRLIFIAFFGEPHGHEVHVPHGLDHHLPLVVLAVFAVFGGLIQLPLANVLPEAHYSEAIEGRKHLLEAISVLVSLSGIAIAWFLFHRNRALAASIKQSPVGALLFRFWGSAWAFDWLYDRLFVRPYLWLVHINRNDIVDVGITGVPTVFRGLHGLLAATQNGRMRGYAAAMAVGACLVIAVVVFL
jgi:NADH-quinone oxidoreductase subunit L